MADNPRVSIGLPVYNGENFLAAAIESVLRQTYRDFELVISDNGSTDATQSICLRYASQDSRIRYNRSPENFGIVWNYNQVFRLSNGRYFMWFSHDDMLAPSYVERCIAVLDDDSSIALCFSNCIDIDSAGRSLGGRHSRAVMDSRDRVARFREAIRLDHLCEAWCGLTRSEAIRSTPLHGSFADYDRVMIAELALIGRLFEIPEPLFLNREHPERSHLVHSTRFARTLWLDPKNAGAVVFPHFRQYREFAAAIGRAGGSWRERAGCHWALLMWAVKNWHRMAVDLKVGAHAALHNVLVRRRSKAVIHGKKKSR